MLPITFAIARVSALICVAGLCFGQATRPRVSGIPSPAAIATNAGVNYCFARVRGLDPERLPPAYLVLQLRLSVTYRNTGTRPLILPLEHERTIYTALNPAKMSVFREHLIEPALKAMKILPAAVSPDSPVTPKNDVFAVIPAGGQMTPPLLEEITLPVDPKGVFKRSLDLRGHRVYIQLRLVHQELSAALKTELSDRWTRFGVPWTGTLTTNTIAIDVPANPQAAPCIDSYTPAHPAVDADPTK